MTPAETGPSAGADTPSDATAAKAAAFDNSLLTQILELVPFGLFVLSGEGKPVYANARAIEILGKGISNETTLADLAVSYSAYVAGSNDPYPVERMPIVRALAGERSSVSDIEIHRDDGKIALEVTGAPLLDGEGRVTHAIAVFHDITATRSVEVTLRRLASDLDALVGERTRQLELLQWTSERSPGETPEPEHAVDAPSDELTGPCDRCVIVKEVEELRENAKLANQALNLFIASFSHEIRTPLNHIIGFSDLIESKIQNGVTHGIAKHAEIIRASGASLLDTIDKIIMATEVKDLDRSLDIFELSSLLREVKEKLEPLAARNGNRIELEDSSDPALARSDSARIRMVVELAVESACTHCTNGIIAIHAVRTGSGTDGMIEITVSATGVTGGSAHDSRLTSGTVATDSASAIGRLGLGLPLAAQMMTILGGSLTVYSDGSSGSRTVISFPACATA